MLKILILTIGTRDIQFLKENCDAFLVKNQIVFNEDLKIDFFSQKEFPDRLMLSNPRNDGKRLIDNYETIKAYIDFPIVRPVIDFINNSKNTIDYFITVYTDQGEEFENGKIEKTNWNKDTLYFSELIEKKTEDYCILNNFSVPVFDSFCIDKNVADLDFLYDYLSDNIKKFYKELIDPDTNLYLLAQGGIDQINTALTLRIIELNPRVKLIQKTESMAPKFLTFPRKFINNIRKNKIEELLKNYSFSAIENISEDQQIVFYSRLANALFLYDYMELNRLISQSRCKLIVENSIFKIIINLLENEDFTDKLRLIYATAKIFKSQRNYNDMLLRLSMLNEILLKPYTEELIESKIQFEKPPFKNFNNNLARNSKLHVYLLGKDNLRKNKRYGDEANYFIPNKATYDTIFNFIFKDNLAKKPKEIELIRSRLNDLNSLRNNLIHSGAGVSLDIIESELKQNEKIESLFEKLDSYFGFSKDMWIFDDLRKILSELNA